MRSATRPAPVNPSLLSQVGQASVKSDQSESHVSLAPSVKG